MVLPRLQEEAQAGCADQRSGGEAPGRRSEVTGEMMGLSETGPAADSHRNSHPSLFGFSPRELAAGHQACTHVGLRVRLRVLFFACIATKVYG